MAKYGKKFRKIQIEEWKKKYLDYKKFKQMINLMLENSVDAFDRVTGQLINLQTN
jgi:SPX domain protein involved in polyphosphate accumulation